MSQLSAWIQTPIARALGWTLVHFLWEGAVLAVALLALLRLFRAEPARRRYAAACFALAAMPMVFAVTLAVVWALRPVAVAAPIHWSAVPVSDGPIAVSPARFSWTVILDRLAWAVPVWLAGVAFFYARGLAGWAAVRRLRRRGVCVPPSEWQVRLDELAARLRISRPVALLESCLTDTPVLVGYLRPLILLPIGCLTGLSTAQVECILLHELAHVVRRDYLVNLLQSLVEGLLFYHPAVWWVSRVVRAERENCCDDRVVELMGDARAYAATLAVLEQRRAFAPEAALAATGGNLMKRIRRLTLESHGGQASVAPAASTAVLLVIFAAALTALPAKLPKVRSSHTPVPAPLAAMAIAAATPQEPAVQVSTPYRKWLTQDVAYIITDPERTAFLALASDAERENFIEQFWKRRDPTPDTGENEYREEHYRRIAYSNEHFKGSVDGWKTDRGRMYIMYGPPDEIDDHSAGGSYRRPAAEGGGTVNTYPFQQWRYRYIEGIGTNVMVEFADQDGTGDYRMTTDPSANQNLPAPYRKWLNEDAAYIITPQERGAFQNLTTDQEREKFIGQFWQQRGEEAKTEHYRRIAYANQNFSTGIPGWKTDRGRIYIVYGQPNTIASFGPTIEWTYGHIEGLGDNVTMQFTDSVGGGEYRLTKGPGPWPQKLLRQNAPAQELALAKLMAELNEMAAQKAAGARQLEALQKQVAELHEQMQQAQDGIEFSQTMQKLEKLQAKLRLARENSDEAAKASGESLTAEQAQAERNARQAELGAREQLINQQMAERNREKSLLEANLQKRQAEALALQVGSAVRIEQSTPGTITLHVPLGSSQDDFHVFAEVRTARNRIIQSAASDVSGQLELAKEIPLPPGKYRLEVMVKNVSTGASRRSSLDFTVDR